MHFQCKNVEGGTPHGQILTTLFGNALATTESWCKVQRTMPCLSRGRAMEKEVECVVCIGVDPEAVLGEAGLVGLIKW